MVTNIYAYEVYNADAYDQTKLQTTYLMLIGCQKNQRIFYDLGL